MLNIAYAMAQVPMSSGTTGTASASSPLVGFMPLILMMVIFYFLLIRPQQKRQKEHANMIANVKKNDEVITTGGVYGTIVGVKDKTFVLRVDENVKIEIQKGAVSQIVKKNN